MPDQQTLYAHWVRNTTIGWLLGFVLVVVLAVAWDMIGGGAQFVVGVGMGTGVGYLQARVVREWGGSTVRWSGTSIVGMGLPFLLWDLGAWVGLEGFFSLPLCVGIGSLLAGVLQRRLLRHHFYRAWSWIPACLVGWGLPAGVIALSDSGLLPGAASLVSVVVMLLGGVVLGAVTGKTLLWMPPR